MLQTYPIEAGKGEKERILPFMPGPLTFVDEEITAERQIDLDKYCKDLLNLPRYLAESKLVQKQLFGIHEGDIELDYDPRIKNGEQTTVMHPNLSVSMQPSNTSSTIHPAVSLPLELPSQQSESQQSQQQHQSQQQQLQQQQIKIKIVHKDDMFAMKVPADCSLNHLRSKVVERIGHNVSMEYKNEASGANEPLEGELDMEEAFVQAIQRGKLTVTAIDLQ